MINLSRNYAVNSASNSAELVSTLNASGKRKLAVNAASRGYKVQADGWGNAGGTKNSVGWTQASSNVSRAILENIFVEDPRIKRKVFRDMYYHDPICGGAVDVYSTLPFSDFHLTGIKDRHILDTYHKSLESLHLRALIPGICIDHLVLGAFIGTSIFDEHEKIFTNVMPQSIDSCEILEIPIFGIDPIIDLILPKNLQSLVQKNDPRIKEVLANIPKEFLDKVREGRIALQPSNTIYIPRRTMTAEPYGVSFYERILPVHLIEKSLMRGTIDQANRRQRALLHVIVGGDDDWIPTQADMEGFRDLFQSADMDPTGAILVTRTGVQTNEVRCLAGNTLLSTDRGMVRIDSLVDHNPHKMKEGKQVDINVNVKGYEGKFVKATAWHFQGIKQTKNYITESGFKLNCTENHKLLCIDNKGNFDLIKAKDVTDKHYLCMKQGGEETTHVLRLPKAKMNLVSRKDNDFITFPEIMTPALAWLLGATISDGYSTLKVINFHNTNKQLINRWVRYFEKLFNKSPKVKHKPARTGKMLGKKYNFKEGWCVEVASTEIVRFLEELGFKRTTALHKKKAKYGLSTSYFKEVPWAILESNSECKIAYLAGYLSGDGSISNCSNSKHSAVEMVIRSTSNKINRKHHQLLSELGYQSRLKLNDYRPNHCGCVSLPTSSASLLYNRMLKYLVPNLRKVEICGEPKGHRVGIPADFFMPLLDSRFMGYKKVANKTYAMYRNDTGAIISVRGGNRLGHHRDAASPILYKRYKDGGYKKVLGLIEQVSKRLYASIEHFLKTEYRFEKIVRVTKGKTIPVYDISINKEDEPIFVANGGILVKNSATDFWSVEQGFEYFSAQKYRAFGLSEGILTGEVSLSTLDASLSVMLDNIRNFRSRITIAFFYEKLFPALAAANDFKADRAQYQVTGSERSYESLGGLSNLITDSDGVVTANCHGSRRYITIGDNKIDTADLLIPKLVYHKTLSPEGDGAFLQILTEMQQMGVPVPISMMAAAGGLNLNEILSASNEDLKMRTRIAKYNAQIAEIAQEFGGQQDQGDDQGGGGQGFVGSNLLAAGASRFGVKNRVGLDKRNYENTLDVGSITPDGKRVDLSVKGKTVLQERVIKKAAEVLANQARKRNHKIKNTPFTTKTVSVGKKG